MAEFHIQKNTAITEVNKEPKPTSWIEQEVQLLFPQLRTWSRLVYQANNPKRCL